ncbi:MAG: rod shape-determining protein RodA [Mariprofundaceae bacterium]
MGKKPRESIKIRKFDPILFITLICLAVLGMIVLYSAVHQGDLNLWYRQGAYWLLALLIFAFFCLIPTRVIALSAWPAYLLVLVALLLIPFIGDIQMGARRWINLGAFHFQPSELMKWTLLLLMSHWFASRDAISLRSVGSASMMVAIPVALIASQPDLGTALILLFSAFILVLVAGLPWRWLGYCLLAASLIFPLLWRYYMHSYQKERIISFLDPQSDPFNSGYHVIQSTIAIGSGGLFGKGYLNGTQGRLHFLPEQHTDFIFAILAEEGGMLAAVLLLLLYTILISRIVLIGAHAHSRFGALFCLGVATIFMLYIVINIGMVCGLLPVVGVPLPFISYGGSALMTMMIALGITMRVAIESKNKLPWQRPGNPLA